MSYDAFISSHFAVKISQTLVFHISASFSARFFFACSCHWMRDLCDKHTLLLMRTYRISSRSRRTSKRKVVVCRSSSRKMLRSLDELFVESTSEEEKKTRISEWHKGERRKKISYNNMNPKKIKTYIQNDENRKQRKKELKNSNNTHTDSRSQRSTTRWWDRVKFFMFPFFLQCLEFLVNCGYLF